jgi:FkbM family methyltransferase
VNPPSLGSAASKTHNLSQRRRQMPAASRNKRPSHWAQCIAAILVAGTVAAVAVLHQQNLIESPRPFQIVTHSPDATANQYAPHTVGALSAKDRHVLEVLPAPSAQPFSKNPKAVLAKIATPVSTPIFIHDVAECKFISRGILEHGSWEPHIQQLLLAAMLNSEVPEGRTPYFFDIGANIGVFSLVIAAAGHHVLAFEPMQYNAELLAASIRKAQVQDRVRLFKTALANSSSADLCIEPAAGGHPKQNRGNGQLAPPDAASGKCGTKQETVPVRSVNDVLAQIPAIGSSDICVNAIKADVEGFENFALRGASSIMTGPCPPCLVALEFNRQYSKRAALQQGYTQGSNGTDVFEYLVRELGYTCIDTTHRSAGPIAPPFTSARDGDYACELAEHPRCRRVGKGGKGAHTLAFKAAMRRAGRAWLGLSVWRVFVPEITE